MINTAKRRELIIDQLCREGSVRVEQLSQQFSVSSVTIRSDLRQLETRLRGARLRRRHVEQTVRLRPPAAGQGPHQPRRKTRHRLRGGGAD